MWAPPCWVSWWTSHRTSVPLQRPAPASRSRVGFSLANTQRNTMDMSTLGRGTLPKEVDTWQDHWAVPSFFHWEFMGIICWDILSCPKARTRLFDNNFQNFLHISSSLFLLMIIYPELTGFCLRWFVIFPIGNPPFGESIVFFYFLGTP